MWENLHQEEAVLLKYVKLDLIIICSLVFSCLTLEQVNGNPNQMNSKEMRSAIMEVVNEQLRSNNCDKLDDVKFYERIMKATSRELTVKLMDPREALRWQWLTHSNQEKNYKVWESTLVELGFGVYSQTDEEKKEHGHVMIDPNQVQNIVQMDEMGFSMDGSKNGKGGRKPKVLENKNVSKPGVPTNKSLQKFSGLYAINFGYEVLPPYFILPSDAQSKFWMIIFAF